MFAVKAPCNREKLRGGRCPVRVSISIMIACHVTLYLHLLFSCMKRLGIFLLAPGRDASPSQVTPSIKFASSGPSILLNDYIEISWIGVKEIMLQGTGTEKSAQVSPFTH